VTRINIVPPSELDTRHLLAEYRELPRVFRLSIRAYARHGAAAYERVPKSYTMGRGHVLFFYDKLLFCAMRHRLLVDELKSRGFINLNLPDMMGTYVWSAPPTAWNDYKPTAEALEINRERIAERLAEMNWRGK
jgi:deoxyribonuclease (pyrimidine dimer)